MRRWGGRWGGPSWPARPWCRGWRRWTASWESPAWRRWARWRHGGPRGGQAGHGGSAASWSCPRWPPAWAWRRPPDRRSGGWPMPSTRHATIVWRGWMRGWRSWRRAMPGRGASWRGCRTIGRQGCPRACWSRGGPCRARRCPRSCPDSAGAWRCACAARTPARIRMPPIPRRACWRAACAGWPACAAARCCSTMIPGPTPASRSSVRAIACAPACARRWRGCATRRCWWRWPSATRPAWRGRTGRCSSAAASCIWYRSAACMSPRSRRWEAGWRAGCGGARVGAASRWPSARRRSGWPCSPRSAPRWHIACWRVGACRRGALFSCWPRWRRRSRCAGRQRPRAC
ncbi:Uncharacterised protein [Bordetella pertussis]|nr:Uncharacterised protein [Bordetella pertussis]